MTFGSAEKLNNDIELLSWECRSKIVVSMKSRLLLRFDIANMNDAQTFAVAERNFIQFHVGFF
jgi:hypothetical protein